MHLLDIPCSGQRDNQPESSCLGLLPPLSQPPPQEDPSPWGILFKYKPKDPELIIPPTSHKTNSLVGFLHLPPLHIFPEPPAKYQMTRDSFYVPLLKLFKLSTPKLLTLPHLFFLTETRIKVLAQFSLVLISNPSDSLCSNLQRHFSHSSLRFQVNVT